MCPNCKKVFCLCGSTSKAQPQSMARMLGRYESPGCCPGTCQGWRRTRRSPSLDCSGAVTDVRKHKRQEQRQVRREIQEEGQSPSMAHSPHRRWKGCPMCKYYKHKGGGSERVPWAVKRKLGKARRISRNDNY